MHAVSLPRPLRLLATGAAVVWLAVGLWGGWLYLSRYQRYRGFPAPVLPSNATPGITENVRFHSVALGGEHRYLVHLPPGYAQAVARGERFGVVYLLHGAPGQPERFLDVGALGTSADTLVAQHRIPPMIYAMPAGPGGYVHDDTEWANAGEGRYENFVLDVVRNVDQRFATIPNRSHRVIAGLSEGGFGAVNIGLRHLGVFSGIQSWSGYFSETPTGPFAGASASAVRDNSPTAYLPGLAPGIRRLGLRAYLYLGRSDSGASQLLAFAAELDRAGAAVRDGFFPGGHDWGLWRHEMPRMLAVAGRWMSTPPPTSAGRAAAPPRRATRPGARTKTAGCAHPRRGRTRAGCARR